MVHRDGFASAGLLKNDKERGKENEGIEEDGKVRVQLDYNGDNYFTKWPQFYELEVPRNR